MSIRNLTNLEPGNAALNIFVNKINGSAYPPATTAGIFITVGNANADYVGGDEVPINAAIVAVAAAGGGGVFIRSGSYACASPIILLDKVNLIGENRATVDIFAVGNPANLITSGGLLLSGLQMSNLKLSGPCSDSVMSIQAQNSVISLLYVNTSIGLGGSTPYGIRFLDPGFPTQFNFVEKLELNGFTNAHIEVQNNVWNANITSCLFVDGGTPATCIRSLGFTCQTYNNIMVGALVGIETSLTCISSSNIFAGCGIAHRIVADVVPPIPIQMVLICNTALCLSFGTTTDFIEFGVPVGFDYQVILNSPAFTGAPFNGINYIGAGTFRYNVLLTAFMTVATDGLGLLYDGVISEPDIPQSVVPTPVLGMVYLDDGTNRVGLGYRRWDGAVWVDF